VRDAIELEWQGIPAVAIVHEALAGSAESMRTMSKMPDYPFVEVRFPLPPVGPWSEAEIEALGDDLVPQIIDRLTSAEAISSPPGLAADTERRTA
jgi:hypothetical protein